MWFCIVLGDSDSDASSSMYAHTSGKHRWVGGIFTRKQNAMYLVMAL